MDVNSVITSDKSEKIRSMKNIYALVKPYSLDSVHTNYPTSFNSSETFTGIAIMSHNLPRRQTKSIDGENGNIFQHDIYFDKISSRFLYLDFSKRCQQNSAFIAVTLQTCTRWYKKSLHYNGVIMSAMVSQITSLTIVYSTAHWGADQRKHESSASLAFVREIHRGHNGQ